MSTHKPTLESLRINRPAAPPPKAGGWMVGVAGVLFAVVAGSWAWLRQPRAVAVQTAVVQAPTAGGDRTLLNASGYVTARREATISSKVTGKVTEVLVEEGMKVEADQVLARLDSSNVEASLKQAQAQLESTQKAIAEILPSLEHAQSELKRIEPMAASDFASKSDLDRYQTEAQAQQAHLDHLQADVAVAQAEVDVWKQQMEDMIVRAPFAGVVISKDAQPGEMVSPISAGGGFTRTGICTIVDMGSLEIDVDVNESYIQRVQPGQPVAATLDAYPDWQIPAKVIAIVPTADRQKATVRVRVSFDKLDPRILPDMSVKVAFEEGGDQPAAPRAMEIPKTAVHEQDGHAFVWVVQNGQAEHRAVTTGATEGADIAIAAGLNAGDKIITNAASPLADGTVVAENKS